MNYKDHMTIMEKLDFIEKRMKDIQKENETLRTENEHLKNQLIDLYKTSQPRK